MKPQPSVKSQEAKKQERRKARVVEMKPRGQVDLEAILDDPDPGMTQKQNQNEERDDPLAA